MKKWLWVLLSSVLFFSLALADEAPERAPVPVPADLPAPIFEAPPRLAISAQEWKELQAAPEYSRRREAAIQAGEALLKNPVTLPNGYGEWIFYYACPDDGATLKTLDATHHQCPVCKKIYSDERTNKAYQTKLHYAAEDAAQALGWAFLFSGDDRFAAEAKRILVGLARQYPTYPPRHDRWGNTGAAAQWGGRRYVQSLDEAVGIIKLAKGYDLSRTSAVWSKADTTLVERDLFGLTAQTLLERNQDTINHQTWYNAGLMAIASVTSDADLVHKVLTMRGGYYDQLNRALGNDGLWLEGAMAYHKYALQAMREIVDAGMRLHLPLQDAPKLKLMITGPFHAAYPDGSIPVINDSDPANVKMFEDDVAWARRIYNDPSFGAEKVSAISEVLPDAGLAILRQGEGANQNVVFLDYGPHGGGHGHYDKLNITLFANGREWLLDPGRLTYSHKEYLTWVKQTAAHNTVTRGGQSQYATTGELLWLKTGEGFTACAAQSDGAYWGVLLRRYLLLTPEFLADVYEVEGEDSAQTDWLAHATAASLAPVDEAGSTPAAVGESAGYQHLSDARKWNVSETSRWDFLSDEKNAAAPRLRLWLLDDEPQEIFTALGIGYTIAQKTPTLIRRRDVKSTHFVTVYDLSGRGDAVKNATWDGKKIGIETAQGRREIAFSPKDVEFH
jgi:hypothetical protein